MRACDFWLATTEGPAACTGTGGVAPRTLEAFLEAATAGTPRGTQTAALSTKGGRTVAFVVGALVVDTRAWTWACIDMEVVFDPAQPSSGASS